MQAQEEEPEEEEEEEKEGKPVSVASRIAAAQAGLKASPPQTPRRTSTTSTTTSRENASLSGSTGSTPSGLVSSRSIGGINTTSKGSAVSSLFKKPQPKPGTGVVVPGAFPKEKGGFAPPPQRVNSAGSGGVERKSPQPPRASPPAPVEEPEEQEYSGEWAEALYNFSSDVRTREPICVLWILMSSVCRIQPTSISRLGRGYSSRNETQKTGGQPRARMGEVWFLRRTSNSFDRELASRSPYVGRDRALVLPVIAPKPSILLLVYPHDASFPEVSCFCCIYSRVGCVIRFYPTI